MSERVKTIAVDFDGVIHAYSRGWADGTIYDEPMPGALDGLRALMAEYAVFIHTSRSSGQVASWLAAYGFEACVEGPVHAPMEFWNEQGRLLVTNRKLPAVSYVDDRALRFTSWEQVLPELLAGDTGDAAAREQAEWDLAMTYLVSGTGLTCPRQDCGEDLPTDDLPPYEFGTLWDALWRHEAEHDGAEPIRCEVVDLPGVGQARVQGDLDEQGAAKLAEVVRAAQRKHVEDLKAEGRAELHEQLRALRAKWNTRRAKREAHRETADGPTARLASIEHDIYARVIDELDQLLASVEAAS
ncbi:hypothetical protein [Microbispora sp. GKU 823]|uniref:hypothetical protein n=1 Tax=Microbispora sp. GKU 823 TaxID=1652100 RepID=UPI0009A2FE66|nr:hypothetical protein [Microbispora sp. GKU 823]OPG13683.1 hypothetical protein B1L11_06765 [Microbispora sp. GKU 823]